MLTFLSCTFRGCFLRLWKLPKTFKNSARLAISKPFWALNPETFASLPRIIFIILRLFPMYHGWEKSTKKNCHGIPFPLFNIHTHARMHAANGKDVRNRGRLIIQVGIGPGYWSLESLPPPPPQFLFLSLLSSFPNHQVGGWVAGWLLVGKQK